MKCFVGGSSKPRVLVFILACNAEKSIESVVQRIPSDLSALYDVHILIIDDASRDSTLRESYGVSRAVGLPFPICVLFNLVTQGCGGVQKLAYCYAIENDFDFVAILRGDGRYPPESLPTLLAPLYRGEADAVFGFRTRSRSGLTCGGRQFCRFVGIEILTWIENRLLHANLNHFHAGYRIYAVSALRSIPFDRNSNDLLFETEIIIQLLIAGRPITELEVDEHSGDEIYQKGGFRNAAKVVAAALKARLQEMSLFYDRRLDCAPAETYSPYTPKLSYESPHTMALNRVLSGSRVLDLGCAGGYLGSRLRSAKHCFVAGMDIKPVKPGTLNEFSVCDLNVGVPEFDVNRYDVVLMLDVIEHLNRPEIFLEDLRSKLALNSAAELLISTANVACFVTRAMLLAGQFNYGSRGILDITHMRLFTFASFRRALVQAGFEILETRGIPAPYPLAIGDNFFSRTLLVLNRFLIRFSRGLFSYQIFMRVKARPSLELLLATAVHHSRTIGLLIENEASVQAGTLSHR